MGQQFSTKIGKVATVGVSTANTVYFKCISLRPTHDFLWLSLQEQIHQEIFPCTKFFQLAPCYLHLHFKSSKFIFIWLTLWQRAQSGQSLCPCRPTILYTNWQGSTVGVSIATTANSLFQEYFIETNSWLPSTKSSGADPLQDPSVHEILPVGTMLSSSSFKIQ